MNKEDYEVKIEEAYYDGVISERKRIAFYLAEHKCINDGHFDDCKFEGGCVSHWLDYLEPEE